MLRLRDSSSATSQAIGPKARRLAAALRQGLPIPDGLLLLPDEAIDLDTLRPALLELAQVLGAGLVQCPGEGGECQQAGDEQTLHLIDSLEWLPM